MSKRQHSWFWAVILVMASLGVPVARAAASAAKVAQALDNPAGVSFSAATSGWELKTGNVAGANLSGITTVGNNYLIVSAPGKANPRGVHSFSLTLKGAGHLSFGYKVSLDDWNESELVLYDGDSETGDLWSADGWWCKDEADWDENGKWEAGMDYPWWDEAEVYLNTQKYSRTLTFTLFGPTSVGYEKPEVDKDFGEVLYDKAWLDNFVWTPDTDNFFFLLAPSPDGTVTFAETLAVVCYSDYASFVFHYTTDGSQPTSSSPVYNPETGIVISETCTVSVVIYENGQPVDGKVYTGLYTKKAGPPQVTVTQQPFSGIARLDFSSETSNALFYYALGATLPQVNADGTPGAGTFKGTSYSLSSDTTINVMAVAPDAVNSEVVTKTFTKLAAPTFTCLLDDRPYSEPSVFDEKATLTLTGPAGATIYYKLDNGAEQIYTAPLTLTASATITAQARQEGKISSEPVSLQVIKASVPANLPALTGGGWQVFSLPGEISQAASDKIIADRQPVAYDAQRRVYAKASRIRGGQAYWVFGKKPEINGILMTSPTEAIGGTVGKWQFAGAPNTVNFTVPDYFLAYRWDGKQKRFVKTGVVDAFGGAWLYNMGAGR